MGFGPLDLGDEVVGVAMAGSSPEVLVTESVENFGKMAGTGAKVEDGGGDVEDIVDFTGVHEANKRVAHDDDVEVGGGKGAGQLGKGLVGEAEDVREAAGHAGIADFPVFASATDKAKENGGIRGEAAGCLEEGVEGVAGAMIAGVHDDKFAVHAMGMAEAFAGGGIEADSVIVSPGRNGGDSGARNPFGGNTVGHEAVEGDDAVGMGEAEAGEAVECAGGQGPGLEPAGSDGFIRVEIHDPINKSCFAPAGEESAQNGDQGGRSEGDNGIESGEEGEADGARGEEGSEVDCSPPFGGFAKGSGANADDADVLPGFATRKAVLGVVVSGAAGKDGDVVAGAGKGQGQISEVLRGGRNVRVKGLVKQQDLQGTRRNGPGSGRPRGYPPYAGKLATAAGQRRMKKPGVMD